MTTDETLGRLTRLHGEAIDAMAETIRLAGIDGAVVALDWLADWMNAQDVVQPGDEKDYAVWLERVEDEKAAILRMQDAVTRALTERDSAGQRANQAVVEREELRASLHERVHRATNRIGAQLAIAEKFLASALTKRQFGDTPDDTWQTWDIAAERFLRRDEVRDCVCGQPERPGTVHRLDGPCWTDEEHTFHDDDGTAL